MKPRTRKIPAAAFLLSGILAMGGVPAQAAEALPAATSISAVYELRFAGLNLGDFNIDSRVEDGEYAVQGSGRLKFITGMLFEMSGGVSSSGLVSRRGASPAAFSFNFKTKRKSGGRMLMTFDGGAVSEVTSHPPLKQRPEAVPVTDKHVEGVLDPLTALFIATPPRGKDGAAGDVCDRRVPVYDGLYRFDLQLSLKKTIQVLKKGKSGYGGPAVICRVKYIPVAGHNPRGSNTVYMMENDDIEIWLIPLPGSGMYAPYHVSIPTPYGTAKATSTAFTIETAGTGNVALVR